MNALLSSVWLLSLPFHEFSLVGTLSLDNIIAPLLFGLLLISISVGSIRVTREQISSMIGAAITILVYFVTHTINLLTTESAVLSSIYGIAKSMLYFVLPILFIRSERDLGRVGDLMMVVMAVGCITALMSALGLVSFEFARQAESRIDLAYIPKSVGFFSSYGDMALLISLSLLLVIGRRKHSVLFGRSSIGKILIVLGIALTGIVSMQSRNVIFTLVTSLLTFYVIGHWRKKSQWKLKLYASLTAGVMLAVITVVLFRGPLIDWVKGLGGTKEAKATVEDRLEQYQTAWSLIENRILLGADPQIIERNEIFVSFIHNMWLKEMVQGGILGIFAMIFIYIRALINQAYRVTADQDSDGRVYLALLVGMLVATQFYPGNTSVFWVLLGIASAKLSVSDNRVGAIPVPKPVQVRDVLSWPRMTK